MAPVVHYLQGDQLASYFIVNPVVKFALKHIQAYALISLFSFPLHTQIRTHVHAHVRVHMCTHIHILSGSDSALTHLCINNKGIDRAILAIHLCA